MNSGHISALILVLVLPVVPPSTVWGDGAGWRNDGTGLYPNAAVPSQWDGEQGKNVLWRSKIGKGQSSAVVCGQRVFVTAEPDRLLCLDRTSGKILWSARNGYAALPADAKTPRKPLPTSPNCGYATPTPVTDGKLVWVSCGSGVVACYDIEGRRRWIRLVDLPQATQYGRSASPLLVDGKLLVSIGGIEALDPHSGATLWQAEEAKPTYGTPAAARIGATAVICTPGGDCVRVSDGRILARKLPKCTYTSPLVRGNVVYYVDSTVTAIGFPEKLGETWTPRKVWENDDVEGEFFASPICCDGTLYCASNEGTLYALDAKTGAEVFHKELEIRAASGKPGIGPANVYPSLCLVGSRILLGNDAGQMLVLEPGKQYRQVSQNYLDKGCGATPVVDGNRIYIRGEQYLYCIGTK
ncbi:MAG: PQQ-binding-like beta-propeller repeat protein [Thermoguttaceae bacterium]|jgi:outer membrane protein assembly factor BamB